MKIVVDKTNFFSRIDKFLRNNFKDLSLGKINSLIRKKDIKVNGVRVKDNGFKLNIGDEVVIYSYTPRDEIYKKEINYFKMDLDIIFEDDYILVVNKPINLPVHSGTNTTQKTLINVLNYLGKKSGYTPFLVHRLDKDTEGLIVVAKNRDVSRTLSKNIKNHNINKFYKAVVVGIVPKEGKFVSQIDNKDAKLIFTKDNVIKIGDDNLSLVNIELITGRKHQIRRQFSENGYPLFGDKKYGNFDFNKKYKKLSNTIYLQSYLVEFKHPISKTKLKFKLNLPERFTKLFE